MVTPFRFPPHTNKTSLNDHNRDGKNQVTPLSAHKHINVWESQVYRKRQQNVAMDT